jgi:hypothetical protein
MANYQRSSARAWLWRPPAESHSHQSAVTNSATPLRPNAINAAGKSNLTDDNAVVIDNGRFDVR